MLCGRVAGLAEHWLYLPARFQHRIGEERGDLKITAAVPPLAGRCRRRLALAARLQEGQDFVDANLALGMGHGLPALPRVRYHRRILQPGDRGGGECLVGSRSPLSVPASCEQNLRATLNGVYTRTVRVESF